MMTEAIMVGFLGFLLGVAATLHAVAFWLNHYD